MLRRSVFLSLLLLGATSVSALTLKESVQAALDTNPEIKAERTNQDAFKRYVDDKRSGYYPTVDLNAYAERSKTDNDSDNGSFENKVWKDGVRANLTLEQMLYDGGLTPSEVAQAKHIRDGNKYKTNQSIETIVLNIVSAYDGLVQYRELMNLSQGMIKTNEENLQTAKEKEAISGEILETYQVTSKLNFVREQYLEEKILEREQKNALVRYLGMESIKGNVCRPNMNMKLIPKSATKAVEMAVKSNYQIKEQVEKIKERREGVSIANAAFLPELTFELQGVFDDDLELAENGTQEELIARLNLNWNLFNGGKDKNRTEQEKLFLKEAKADLEGVTRQIASQAKNLYFEFQKNKERIDVLKRYVMANRNIVKVYIEEFESGTRTFVDILNAEIELYQSEKSLRNREFAMYDNYYNLLYTFSNLSTSILSGANNKCFKTSMHDSKKPSKKMNMDKELKELFKDNKKKSSEVQTPQFFDNSKKYTLSIATYSGDRSHALFSKGVLNKKEGMVYKFRYKDKLYSKVLYKKFSTLQEAKKALKSLDQQLVQVHKPYVDVLSKHKALYEKNVKYNR